ncbi:TSUP family transporter [Rhodobacterales bacterium HKCCE2091]|nr:TSUP family transporter [Rhodobacterales bacterium HKCCE2091]
MDQISALMPLWAFAAAAAVTLAAGFVKGAVGFAMPLVMISGLTLFLPPEIAVAGIILPIVLSNLWQALRFGRAEALRAMRETWRYILIVCVMILIVAQFVTLIAPEVFYLVLGIPVVILSLIQLLGVRFHIPDHRRRAAEWGVGALAGALGGLTGTWGPPTVLYLMALETPKARAILVQGVVYGMGSISLLVGHLHSGVLNWSTLPFSAALLLPALIGQGIGMRASDRLNPELFRRVTLIVLIVSGLNLIRRGLFG